MKSDREVVLAAVSQDGDALQFAVDSLKEDREVVKAAVCNKGSALKFAKGGLNQDEEMLKASGLWNMEDNKQYPRSEQAILSVKFSLAEQSTPYATNFALAMKDDPYLGQFETYNPNAWCKRSCDPAFTNMQHPCRGTSATCEFSDDQNLTADTKKPCATSCWRYAFRFHQEASKETGGFMIQVEEWEGLGAGQEIETEMAKQVDLKVFRAKQNHYDDPGGKYIKAVSERVEAWYKAGCTNNDMEEF